MIDIHIKHNPNNLFLTSMSSDLSKFREDFWNGGSEHTGEKMFATSVSFYSFLLLPSNYLGSKNRRN